MDFHQVSVNNFCDEGRFLTRFRLYTLILNICDLITQKQQKHSANTLTGQFCANKSHSKPKPDFILYNNHLKLIVYPASIFYQKQIHE